MPIRCGSTCAGVFIVHSAMNAICMFSYLSQDRKNYTEPSLFNFMVSTAFIGSQIALGFALRYINRPSAIEIQQEEPLVEIPAAPPLWQDMVQQDFSRRVTIHL